VCRDQEPGADHQNLEHHQQRRHDHAGRVQLRAQALTERRYRPRREYTAWQHTRDSDHIRAQRVTQSVGRIRTGTQRNLEVNRENQRGRRAVDVRAVEQ